MVINDLPIFGVNWIHFTHYKSYRNYNICIWRTYILYAHMYIVYMRMYVCMYVCMYAWRMRLKSSFELWLMLSNIIATTISTFPLNTILYSSLDYLFRCSSSSPVPPLHKRTDINQLQCVLSITKFRLKSNVAWFFRQTNINYNKYNSS